MVDEKTHPNYLSLLSYVIYYIIRAFGTHNVIYYVLEQGHVIWIRFFIHHTNKPLLGFRSFGYEPDMSLFSDSLLDSSTYFKRSSGSGHSTPDHH